MTQNPQNLFLIYGFCQHDNQGTVLLPHHLRVGEKERERERKREKKRARREKEKKREREREREKERERERERERMNKSSAGSCHPTPDVYLPEVDTRVLHGALGSDISVDLSRVPNHGDLHLEEENHGNKENTHLTHIVMDSR